DEAHVLAALQQTHTALAGKSCEDLLHLPAMTAPDKLAAARIMACVLLPALSAAPNLYTCIILQMVRLSLEWGETPETALAYTRYGVILCAMSQEIDTGYRFGQYALKLVEHGGAEQYKASINYVAYWAIFPWKDSLQRVLQPLAAISQMGLDGGDLQTAA